MRIRTRHLPNNKVLLFTAAPLLIAGITLGAYALRPTPHSTGGDKNISRTSETDSVSETPLDNEPVYDTAPLEAQSIVTVETEPVTSSNPPTEPQPVPITVTGYSQIALTGTENIDCKFTYSDGSSYQWHWQTVKEQGSWVTDSSGNNGRWVKSTTTSGSCDQSVIGRTKN